MALLDKTKDIVLQYQKNDKRITIFTMQENKGVGGARIFGFKKALGDQSDIVVIMDGDNQMDSNYLPNLLQPIIDDKVDFTKGDRLKIGFWKGMSFFRLFGNFLLTYITKFITGYWKLISVELRANWFLVCG